MPHVEDVSSSTSGGSASEEEALAQSQGRARLQTFARATGLLLFGVAGFAAMSRGSVPGHAKDYFLARFSDMHLISEAEQLYSVSTNSWCDHAEHSFRNLDEAQAACGGLCPGVYSIRCDAVYGFALCKPNAAIEASSVGSCVYAKNQGASVAKPMQDLSAIEKQVANSHIATDDINSAKCKIAVFAMAQGMCEPGAGIKSTCAPPLAEMEASCERWFGSGHLAEGDKQARIARCKESAAKTAANQAATSTDASRTEEQNLCLQCDMDACKSKPTFQVAQEVMGHAQRPVTDVSQHFPPDGSKNHCRPMMNGEAVGVQHRVRRSIHMWNDYDFAIFKTAMNDLRNVNGGVEDESSYPNTYGAFTAVHRYGHPMDFPQFNLPCPVDRMNGPFIPWHRHTIHDLETSLQKIADNCSVTLPYWNSNLEAGNALESFVWDPSRYGGKGGSPTSPGTGLPCQNSNGVGYCLVDGIAAGWQIPSHQDAPPGNCDRCLYRSPKGNKLQSAAVVFSDLQQKTTYEEVNDYLNGAHVEVHAGIVNGWMGDLEFSPRDPIFFLHHAYTDRLFNWWQHYHAARGVDTSICKMGDGDMLLLHNEPKADWIGEYKLELGCTMLPKSNPRVCIKYESEMPVPEGRGSGGIR